MLKRFEFSSVISGVLSGCLEIGSLITTLLVSYFCTKSHIPRSIAFSTICCAIGSSLYALPHFMSSSYTANNRFVNKTTDDLVCRNMLLNNELNESMALDGVNVIMNAMPMAKKSAVIKFLNKFEIDPSCLLKPSNYGNFFILILANVLIGCSSAPLYTLGTTYIDNHVSIDNSSVYLGKFDKKAI